ncbi:MAG: tRNA (5-methylaminomethyl-2-thiouridine)(34)-methyltransferase MnmD [Caulobacteraceae bacterium]
MSDTRSASPVEWDDEGHPRSSLYGDVYFSATDALAESRAVFLAGCGLPERWRGRREFTVGELGFGTGRNIVALLDLWRRTRPSGAGLSIFTIEAHPMEARDAARALSPWPEVAGPARLLTARWPGKARGFHRIDIGEFGAIVDVAIMPAIEALKAWTGRADAWFLDGFSPTRNPAMWRPELMRLIVERSAPGARAASYTAAGSVRRDLVAAGFAVERARGAGNKRHRLEAVLPGAAPAPVRRPRVAIIGAGIAGASLARAFADLGAETEAIDVAGPGAGASGAPAALVAPRLDAGLAAPAALFAQACRRAISLYASVERTIVDRGLVQFETGPKDASRFAAIAASDLFEPEMMTPLSAAETSARFGEPAPPGLLIADALVIEPAVVLPAWLGPVRAGKLAALAPLRSGWRGLGADGGTLFEADVVCLAAGMACARLFPGLPLIAVRGQATLAPGLKAPLAAAFGGYVIPAAQGAIVGATHDRGEEQMAARAADEARNLAGLRGVLPGLAARLAGGPLRAWTGVRAATSDYLPIAGKLGPGLFVLTGLGSRGFTLAPLLAEHVAAEALGAPSPLPARAVALVSPGRFAVRSARKGR